MVHIVVDLEMNPLGKEFRNENEFCRSEIIEIGAVAVNDRYDEIGNFVLLVKPQINSVISKKIEDLTGITTDKVKNAPYFAEAVKAFLDWCEIFSDEVEIVQWSESDRTQLINEAQLKNWEPSQEQARLLREWADLQLEYNRKIGLERQVSLKDALMYADLDFAGHEHDALYDARNTARLLKIVRTPELCEKALGAAMEALKPKPVGASLGEMFDFGNMFNLQ